MYRFRLYAFAAGMAALTASVPVCAQTSAPQETGDNALRTHGHGIHATATATGGTDTSLLDTVAVAAVDATSAPDTTMTPTPPVDTAAVAVGRDSLDDRARADSLGRANAALWEELAGPIHFAFDRSGIQPAARASLDRKATILAANPGMRVRIAGYCDERGSAEYNLALGNRRAAAAKQYLIEKGIDAGRLDVVSFGSGSPVDSGQNEAAWALNRRAAFDVSNSAAALTTPVAPSVDMAN